MPHFFHTTSAAFTAAAGCGVLASAGTAVRDPARTAAPHSTAALLLIRSPRTERAADRGLAILAASSRKVPPKERILTVLDPIGSGEALERSQMGVRGTGSGSAGGAGPDGRVRRGIPQRRGAVPHFRVISVRLLCDSRASVSV
ncbi:hypothetical protein GCM10009564_28110 [Streptomyces thermogriseus]|uniref:Secreted protein n=1 Tax=Streptomyces thermogriseus TaxID=75292 RepID=A0ABN1T015_9ACTN